MMFGCAACLVDVFDVSHRPNCSFQLCLHDPRVKKQNKTSALTTCQQVPELKYDQLKQLRFGHAHQFQFSVTVPLFVITYNSHVLKFCCWSLILRKLSAHVHVQCSIESVFKKSLCTIIPRRAADPSVLQQLLANSRSRTSSSVEFKTSNPAGGAVFGMFGSSITADTRASGSGHTQVWCWWWCREPHWWSSPVGTPPGSGG